MRGSLSSSHGDRRTAKLHLAPFGAPPPLTSGRLFAKLGPATGRENESACRFAGSVGLL
jgi:hypothetical protein